MTLVAYSMYAETGTEWLGKVPSHWTRAPLGQFFSERKQVVSDAEYRALSVTKAGIVPQLETAAKTDNGENRKRVSAGDFVINSRSDRKGSAGISDHEGSVSLISTVLTPKGMDSRFVHNLLRSRGFQEEYFRFGTGIVADLWSTRYTQMKQIELAVPPLDEQRQIAKYLDRETGKIDELITKQEQLVATLTERRQTLISLTVCSGLGPPAPVMTGNSWFPVIPHGWKVGAIKHYARRITDGAHISPDTEGGIYDFVSTKDVTSSGIHFDGALKTTRETYEYMVKTGCQPALGDLLLSKDGTIGRTTVVVENRDFVVASSLIIISPAVSRLNSMFLNYLCQSSPVQEQIRSFVKGAGLPRLSIANLLRVVGLIPPMEQQIDIVEYLDRTTAAINALVESAVALILLMRERRAALISAAVTGKIDVRGL